MFIFSSLFLFVITYVSTIFVDVVFADSFLKYNKIGQRMSTWPKPFSCAACLSGWLSFIFWGGMAILSSFPYVSLLFGLLAAYLAARYLNSATRNYH